MALYRELARRVWPGLEIRCAIIWTSTATLMPVPSKAMDLSLEVLAGHSDERPS